MRREGFVHILLAVLVVVLIGATAGYFALTKTQPPIGQQCTMEAKLCPDGSAVGRTGPNCEFAQCPTNTVASSTASWKTYRNEQYGFEFKYPGDWEVSGESPDEVVIEPIASNSNEVSFTAVGYDAGGVRNLDEWTKQKFSGFNSKLFFRSTTTLTGLPAIRIEDKSGVLDLVSLFVMRNDDVIQVGYLLSGNRQIVYDQILSTFKFIR